MKHVFTLRHTFCCEWTFFANNIFEAISYGKKICDERGWQYIEVTTNKRVKR